MALSWTGAPLHQTMEGFRDFLVIGLYLGYPLAALADGEARRLGTLRNEVSYGLPWGRIYLGKLCSALLAGTVLFLLTAAVFFAVGFPLSEHRQIQPDRLLLAWAGLLTGTLSAFPRYIGAVGLAHLLCFSLRSSGLGLSLIHISLPAEADIHARLAMLQGVADQVGKDPQHPRRVCHHGGQVLRQLHSGLKPGLLEVVIKLCRQLAEDVIEVHLLPGERVLSPLQPGELDVYKRQP